MRAPVLLLSVVLLPGCNSCNVENVEKAPGLLDGTVCHQVDGRPSIGATLSVDANAQHYSTASDRDGQYQLHLPPGTHTVTAEGEGVHVSFPVTIVSDQTTTYVDPACIAGRNPVGTGCVAGQVCNRHTGAWVQGATVTVILSNVDYTGSDTALTTTTSADGIFQLCGVPEGNHTVQVSAAGYQKAYPAHVVAHETDTVVSSATCSAFDPLQYCEVQGRACLPTDPVGWLGGAAVTALMLNQDDTPVSPAVTEEEPELSAPDGRYSLFLRPAGRWRVQVQKGSFLSRTTVTCQAGTPTVIPEGTACVEPSGCRFLVVQGMFDRVEEVLTRVGVPASQVELINGNPANPAEDWAFRAFGQPGQLEGVCGVFFNCGITETAFWGPLQNPTVVNNLRTYVEQGGTLYASDQSYDVVEALFPAKVDWFGHDEVGGDAEYGLEGLVHASITEDGLQAYLQQAQPGQNRVDINFVYQRWAVVQAADPDVQVFLRAGVEACADGEACTRAVGLPDTALTLRFPVGTRGGKVVFTSFHVETGSADGGSGPVLSTVDTDRVLRYLMTL